MRERFRSLFGQPSCRNLFPLNFLFCSLLLSLACQTQKPVKRSSAPQERSLEPISELLALDPQAPFTVAGLYLAQTHVLPFDHPYCRLVSSREVLVLLKLQAKGERIPAPLISLTAKVAGKELTRPLTGPAELSPSVDTNSFSFSSDFTATLPADFVQQNLSITLTIGGYPLRVQPVVGAANPLTMSLLQFHVFEKGKDFPEPQELYSELEAKLPVSRLQLERVKPWIFREVVIPPRPDVGLRAFRVRSAAEYKSKALAYLEKKAAEQKLPFDPLQAKAQFDGEQGWALGLANAVQNAAGRSRLAITYAFTSVLSANGGVGVGGGLADPFTAMGPAGNWGVLWHELGHTLSLPHWANNPRYPYQNEKEGITVGRTWGYDARLAVLTSGLRLPSFIPPTVQANSVAKNPQIGTFKRDPMAGGGSGDEEQGFHLRMFSDFSSQQMQAYLEKELVHWEPNQAVFVKWDPLKKSYSAVESNGVDLPAVLDQEIYTLIYSASSLGPQDEAHFLYPPQGPYRSSVIRSFDPTKEEDRKKAEEIYCKPRCDLTLRTTQAGTQKYSILRAQLNPNAKDTDLASHLVGAIHIPAAEGPIEEAELLLTPDVTRRGLPSTETVLFRWRPLSL